MALVPSDGSSVNQSSLRKTPIITPKKTNLSPEDAYENTAYEAVFEIVKFETTLWSVGSSLFCEIDITKKWLPDMELIV